MRFRTRLSNDPKVVSLAFLSALLVVGHAATSASASTPQSASALGSFGIRSADPSQTGEWLPPFSESGVFDERPAATKDEAARLPTAASIAVSPDGTVMYWNGPEDLEHVGPGFGGLSKDTASRTRILDLRRYLTGKSQTPTWVTPSQERGIGGDLFCSDLRNLSDGRLFAVGGTTWENLDASSGLPGGGRPEIWGRDDARIYDPVSGRWTSAEPMHHKRWYPTLVTLPDGELMVAGGVERAIWYWTEDPTYVNETETFDPETGKWTENGPSGEATLPYYARLHLLPNGEVFYDATGQMWGPGGTTADMAEWNIQKSYNPKNNSWSNLGPAPLGARSGTFSAMLPLKTPYDKARILIGGGTISTVSPPSAAATSVTEIVEVTDGSIERTMGPMLNNPRWYSSGVVLPSGEVVAINGGDKDDTFVPGTTNAVRQPEMFDGTKWTSLAPGTRERVYHNTAILLADGSVLVGGHAPLPALMFGPGNDNYVPGAFSSNFRDPSFEIFKPPYLFRGPRPRLAQVQAGVALGDRFKITTPDASKVQSVVLSRLPAVTHLADADQRTVELQFTRRSSGTLVASAPEDPAVLLPGHYYLFLMADNGQGPTPSRAAMIQVGERDNAPALLPFGS